MSKPIVLVACAVGAFATCIVYRRRVWRAWYRVSTVVKAIRWLLVSPREVFDRFFASYKMFEGESIGKDTRYRISDWYGTLNHLCALGDVERMYLPPVMEEGSGISRNQDLLEELMCHDLKAGPDSRILELGCGRGRILAHMHEVSGGARCTGLNIEPGQIDAARSYARMMGYDERMRFEVRDYNDPLPFEDGSFDAVYNIGAITYTRDGDFARLFREVSRVLRPGGRLASLDWSGLPALDLEHNERHREMYKATKELIGAVRTPTMPEMADCMRKAGLTVIKNEVVGKDGLQYPIILRAVKYFVAVQKIAAVLGSIGLMPKSLEKLLDRFNRGGEALVEGEKMRLWTMCHYFVGEKPLPEEAAN